MKYDDAARLLEILMDWSADKPESAKTEARQLAAALQIEMTKPDDEEDDFDSVVTAKDLVPPPPAPTADDAMRAAAAALPDDPGYAIIQGMVPEITRELAESHNVFVVDEPVRAGDVPPDEMVYRKAK